MALDLHAMIQNGPAAPPLPPGTTPAVRADGRWVAIVEGTELRATNGRALLFRSHTEARAAIDAALEASR